MTALKQQFSPHLQVVEGGKKKQTHPNYWYWKRKKKRKQYQEQKNEFFADSCAETLRLMQKIARASNPAFYFERLVPHYEVLRTSVLNSLDAENYSTDIIQRELCIYMSFAHMNPQRLQDYQKVLMKGEDEFTALYKEREENTQYKLSGLRLIARNILFYVVTSELELFLEINQQLIQYKDEPLTQLFYNMTVHINFLKHKQNE